MYGQVSVTIDRTWSLRDWQGSGYEAIVEASVSPRAGATARTRLHSALAPALSASKSPPKVNGDFSDRHIGMADRHHRAHRCQVLGVDQHPAVNVQRRTVRQQLIEIMMTVVMSVTTTDSARAPTR